MHFCMSSVAIHSLKWSRLNKLTAFKSKTLVWEVKGRRYKKLKKTESLEPGAMLVALWGCICNKERQKDLKNFWITATRCCTGQSHKPAIRPVGQQCCFSKPLTPWSKFFFCLVPQTKLCCQETKPQERRNTPQTYCWCEILSEKAVALMPVARI